MAAGAAAAEAPSLSSSVVVGEEESEMSVGEMGEVARSESLSSMASSGKAA